MKRTAFVIVLSVLILAFSCVAFSASYDDLKKIFVTRDDVNTWSSSMSSTLNGIEVVWQESIQNEVGYQMYRRGIKLPTEEGSTIDPSIMTSWSKRRESELHPLGGVPPFSSPAPEEKKDDKSSPSTTK